MSQPVSDAQAAAIDIIPRVTAALSVMGSGSIMVSVAWSLTIANNSNGNRCCTRPRGRVSGFRGIVGQKLLLGMSVADFLSSLSYVVGDVAFPVEDGGKGNRATCNLQGFMCNLQVGAALYSGFLAVYYCLFIRYKWRPDRLGRVYEPWAHLISWSFPAATGIASIAKEIYNKHWIRCYIAGPGTNLYFWFMFYAPVWASMICGSVAMLLVYFKVRETETRSLRFTFQHQQQSMLQPSVRASAGAPPVALFRRSTESFGNEDGEGEHNKPEQEGPRSDGSQNDAVVETTGNHHDDPSHAPSREASLSPSEAFRLEQRAQLADLPVTRRVAVQGLWYTGCFLMVYIFPTTSRTWSTVASAPPFIIRLLATSFVVSQGFFNFLVYYLQPRVYDWLLARRRRRERMASNPSHGIALGLSSRASSLMSRPIAPLQRHESLAEPPPPGEPPPPATIPDGELSPTPQPATPRTPSVQISDNVEKIY